MFCICPRVSLLLLGMLIHYPLFLRYLVRYTDCYVIFFYIVFFLLDFLGVISAIGSLS